MRALRAWLLRLLAMFQKGPRELELSEELESHLQMHISDNVRAGMSEGEARRQALIKLGGREATKEIYRERRGLPLVETLLSDARFGARMLRKDLGFTAVAILTLALGIGANAAVFSIVNGVLLHPLPFANADRLVMIGEREDDAEPSTTSFATYEDWKARSKSFEELSLYRQWQPTLMAPGEPEQLIGLRVTNDYFRTLGIRMAAGRDFAPTDDKPTTRFVVILSHGLWQRRFNSDPGIVGRAIHLSGTSFTVAGVLPSNYESLIATDARASGVEIWGALGYDAILKDACRTCRHLRAIGRLRPGVTVAQAGAELSAITDQLWKEHPTEFSAGGAVVMPVYEQLLGGVSKTLYVLLGAVGFVLLIACANLANLLLARATHREREMAMRAALGAGRGRIIRQVLVENCSLALAGGPVGLLLAYWMPEVLALVRAKNLPRLDQVRIDWHVLGFAFAIALFTGLLSGAVPAMRMTKIDLRTALQQGTRGSSPGGGGTRSFLIVSEIALSLTLLLGAGLLVRSLVRLVNVHSGFAPAHVLTLRVSPVGARYAKDGPVREYLTRVNEKIRTIPGVVASGTSSQIPFGGNFDTTWLHVEGKMNANAALDPTAERYVISDGYLDAMGIRLLRGRDFTISDAQGAEQVMLVNETAAREIWPGEDPIGQHVHVSDPKSAPRTVVGIVDDVHHYALDAAPTMQFYVPVLQTDTSDLVFAVRCAGEPSQMANTVRQAIRSVDETLPIYRITPMNEYVAATMANRRLALILLGSFAGIALILSVVGIYGVTEYTVAQRTREIGIRMALGAQSQQVLRLLLWQSAVLSIAGVVLGTVFSFALMGFLRSLVFGVTMTDPVTLFCASVILTAAAVLACWVPSRKVMRVDPMVALRCE
jgi:putative ABC transport system permease protein